jgi:two-component system, OmpR family, sensor histidine kinase PhoQ
MGARSLSTRLLASVSLLLVVFFGVTVAVLDGVYRRTSDEAMRARLDLHVSSLISASDEHTGARLSPGDSLREVRFENLGSGLYGELDRDDGEVMWRSESLTGTGLDLQLKLKPGQKQLRRLYMQSGKRVLALSVGLEWEFPGRKNRSFVYTVAEDLEAYRAQLNKFRSGLIGWFAGLMALLLAALAGLLRWVLRPLRRVEREIEGVEAGQLSELGGGYPRELSGITANMNTLLRTERSRLERYRNTLGNLAHSLKTPLAVARALANTPQLQEQITRMDDIVRYQLKRASMSGGSGLGSAPVDVAAALAPLRETLLKVYADKQLDLQFAIDPKSRFVGEQGDLLEIAGNLLDNACKWSRKQVSMSAQPLITPGTRREGLLMVVEDDGPGIAPEQRQHVLKRGARLDERVSGQGIGLSVVQDLAQLAGGGVEIDSSALGGCRITVRLPAP